MGQAPSSGRNVAVMLLAVGIGYVVVESMFEFGGSDRAPVAGTPVQSQASAAMSGAGPNTLQQPGIATSADRAGGAIAKPEAESTRVSVSVAGDTVVGDSISSAVSEVDVTGYLIPVVSPTGDLTGYRLAPNGQRSPRFEHLGLLPTDTITAIHALPLTQSQNTIRALERLLDDDFASITFIRDGNKLITITIMSDAEPGDSSP